MKKRLFFSFVLTVAAAFCAWSCGGTDDPSTGTPTGTGTGTSTTGVGTGHGLGAYLEVLWLDMDTFDSLTIKEVSGTLYACAQVGLSSGGNAALTQAQADELLSLIEACSYTVNKLTIGSSGSRVSYSINANGSSASYEVILYDNASSGAEHRAVADYLEDIWASVPK